MEFGEIPIVWKRGKTIRIEKTPSLDNLESSTQIGKSVPNWTSLLIPRGDKDINSYLKDISEWLTETQYDGRLFKLYAVYGFSVHTFRVERTFYGIDGYFLNYMDAVHIKLSICADY